MWMRPELYLADMQVPTLIASFCFCLCLTRKLARYLAMLSSP